MITRMFLAALLSASCAAFAGCGSSMGTTAEAPTGTPTAAEIAEAEAEMERVADEERAYQAQEKEAAKAR